MFNWRHIDTDFSKVTTNHLNSYTI